MRRGWKALPFLCWIRRTHATAGGDALVSPEEALHAFVGSLPTPAVYVRENNVVMNRAARALLGYTDEEVATTEQWFSALYGQVAPDVRSIYTGRNPLAHSQPMTLPVRHAEGHRLWIQFSTHFAGNEQVWLLNDVTEQLETWNRLHAAEARWQALVESLPGWVTQVALDGTIEWISHTPDGRPASEVVGHSVVEFLRLSHGGDAERILEEIAARPRPSTLETDEVLPDGRHRFYEHHVGPLMEGARCAGFVVHSVDVTERHRRQELLRERELQLLQARKMEALGRMAGGVAHDLNNLLTVIQGGLDLATEDMPSNHPVRSELVDMQQAATQAADLVRELLAMSRGQPLEPIRTDFNQILGRLGRVLQSQLPATITLTVELTPDPPAVMVDVGQMSQVVTNLVLNARDAMPEGGRVHIFTERMDLETDLATTECVIPAGTYAVLHVEDGGVGIDAEARSHLFEPFFTTKAEGRGTGLGLAVVYDIVQQSAGYIWLDTEPGRGTTFHVALPAVAE